MKNKTGIIVLVFTLLLVAVSVANLFMTLNPAEGLEVTNTDKYVAIGFAVVTVVIAGVCGIKVVKESKAAKEELEAYDDDDDDDDE